jgi:hypothetical protein
MLSSFTPEFEPRTISSDKDNLNNLFIKLSGITSYSTIESGYLQRHEKIKYKELVTTREHNITSLQSSAPEINDWKVVISNLNFEKYERDYEELNTYTAEEGYFTITYDKKRRQKEKEKEKETNDKNHTQNEEEEESDDSCLSSVNRIINPGTKQSIAVKEMKINFWQKRIKEMALNYKDNEIPYDKAINKIKSYLNLFKELKDEDRTSASDYDLDVNELRRILDTIKQNPKYQALSDYCQKLYETQFITKYKTIDEIVNEVYAANSS